MLVLMLFAFVAGAGTAISPCVLPVLPALLSAGAAGGRRRPAGVVTGLAVTFFVTIVGLAKVVDGVGLGADPLRYAAVGVLGVFGLSLLLPTLAAQLESRLAGLSRLGPRTRGDGFVSGLVVGGALGFVYTPCAGPILAAVISVSAASGRAVGVALAYAVGTALMLLVLALGGRRVFAHVRAAGRGPGLQRALGVVMLATALAIGLMLDVRLDQQIAEHIPDVNLTAGLERSHSVSSRLTSLRSQPTRFAATAAGPLALRDYGPAPALHGTQRWLNSPPLTLAGLRGRVVLIDFWTYTCINCIRTLPYLEAWDARYRQAGLTIIGVHAPEFAFERDAGNVAAAVRRFGIRYPVVQDNAMTVWSAFGNQYWPADYLIDRTGHVRRASFGEGDYGGTEAAIRALLGNSATGPRSQPRGAVRPSRLTTPETYLGFARAQGFAPPGPIGGTRNYGAPPARLPVNAFALGGRWTIGPERAQAQAGATIEAEIEARNVYMVLSPPAGRVGRVEVLIDGRPVGTGTAGGDAAGGAVAVTRQRLYWLVALPGDQRHRLSVRVEPGTSGYSFTFG